MNTEVKYRELDVNWRNLEREAGEELTDLSHQMQSIISQLPEYPNRDDMKWAVAALDYMLNRYHYGRELLSRINGFIDDEPDESESYDQLRNRLRKLFGGEQNEREVEEVSIPARAKQISE